MKKTLKLLLATILLFFNSCNDEEYSTQDDSPNSKGVEITEDIAKEVALNFYNRTYKSSDYLLRTVNETSSVGSTETIEDFNGQTGIYSININPKGYVLVTSNSKNVPIAAHSENGTFEFDENSPDGLKSWIAENILFNDLLEAREPIEEIDKQWYYLSEGRMPYPGDGNDYGGEGDGGNGSNTNSYGIYSHTVNEQIGPLMQTTWGQRNPYNNFTPNDSPTGCVAVATAQIMRYHEWPNAFNWSIMPNEAPFNDTSNGTLEIASLMSDIGINVNMSYSASGSSAYSEDARNALVNNYGYSSTANYSAYNFFTVQQNIKWGYPVYMDGYHSYETTGWWFWEQTTHQDGHAWVCDGYKQQYDVYIHNEGTQYEYITQENSYEWLYMNWGWNSNGNGWFYKNHLRVYDVEILVDENEVNPNFQYNRKCIYRIKP